MLGSEKLCDRSWLCLCIFWSISKCTGVRDVTSFADVQSRIVLHLQWQLGATHLASFRPLQCRRACLVLRGEARLCGVGLQLLVELLATLFVPTDIAVLASGYELPVITGVQEVR